MDPARGPLPSPRRSQRFLDAWHGKSVTTTDEATIVIRGLAECQHGVVARRQLVEAGLGPGLIADRLRGGRLVPVHQGVFALGHRRIGRYGEWIAAVLASGPGAILSYASAAQLWGIRGSAGPTEVTRTSGNRRPHGIRLHQTRSLPVADIAEVADIPVTSIERTLLDMAARLDRRQMERMLVSADRSGQLSWPLLQRVLERPGGRKGAASFRRLSRQVDPRALDTRSPTEVDFLALCREARLPLPEVNVLVEGRLVDFFWPGARLVVETDSYTYHGDRPAFERDHESTVALLAAGYEVRRVTHRMLERNPEPFMHVVRQALNA